MKRCAGVGPTRARSSCSPGQQRGRRARARATRASQGFDELPRGLAARPSEGRCERALEECAAAGVRIERFAGLESSLGSGPSIIVDALLGIGADRPLAGDFAAAAAAANASGAPVLALDIPSGLHADTGWPLGDAIRATATVTFVALKQGLYLLGACDYTGDIELADLGVPADVARGSEPALTRLVLPELVRALPPRPRSAHKGTSGRLLLLGGGRAVGRDPARVRGGAARRSGPRLRRRASR